MGFSLPKNFLDNVSLITTDCKSLNATSASPKIKGLITDFQDLPYPPGTPAYDASKMKVYSFDLEKARSLLQASGVSSPEIDLTYSSTQFGDINQTLAQIMQADLLSIGVKVNLKPVDFATQFDVASRRAYNGLLLSVGSGGNAAEATSLLTRSRFFSPDPKTSFTGFSSDEYQNLISTASVEPDAAKRRALYGQIEDIMLDESVSITISLYPQTAVARKNVHDLVYDAEAGPDVLERVGGLTRPGEGSSDEGRP